MMTNRKGRPAIPDEATLRRVAEYMVAQEERGKHCSARAAILRTSYGGVTGNSRDADLWRLQRKWGRQADQLLAEVRERRARARRSAISGPGLGPAMASLTHLARAFSAPDEIKRIQDDIRRQFSLQDEIKRIQDDIRRQFSLQDEIRRIQDEVRRQFSLQDEVRRLTGAW